MAPRDYLATQRLLLAKQLLTDTALPVTQVALASGFESVRRFNAAFAERYRLNPTQLRREGAGDGARAADECKPLRLAWRPPLDAEALIGFFERRQVRGIEQVEGLELRRTIGWPHGEQRLVGWLTARLVPERNELHLSVSPSLAQVLGAVLQRVRQVFDLDADATAVDAALASLPLPPRPGVRLPGSLDGFETGVRVILGQQVTVKAARTLVQRLADRYGTPIETPYPGLTRVFPDAATIAAAAAEDLGKLGIVRQRVGALQALARALLDGRLSLHRGAPLQPTLATLRALPGVGEWTAQLIAMRALAWPDAWPAGDIGLMKALGTRDPKQLGALAQAWRPWRAYAVMRLWHHLETPR